MGEKDVIYIKSRQMGMSHYLYEYNLAKILGFNVKFEPNKYAAPWLKEIVDKVIKKNDSK